MSVQSYLPIFLLSDQHPSFLVNFTFKTSVRPARRPSTMDNLTFHSSTCLSVFRPLVYTLPSILSVRPVSVRPLFVYPTDDDGFLGALLVKKVFYFSSRPSLLSFPTNLKLWEIRPETRCEYNTFMYEYTYMNMCRNERMLIIIINPIRLWESSLSLKWLLKESICRIEKVLMKW